MKIAFVSFYSGSVNRGVEAVVNELGSRLAKSHVVTVFQEGREPNNSSYKVIRTPMNINRNKKDMTGTVLRRFFVDYWSLKIGLHTVRILKTIWKNKYHIVVPLNGGWQPALLRLITWLYGGKLIVSGQSGMGWDDRNNIWCFPDVFVALSSKAKKWAEKAGPFLKNVIYIPNGVDLTKFKPSGNKFDTKLKPPIVLTVGALTPQKRINLVVEAVSKLDDVSLLVAAGDKDRIKLSKLGGKLQNKRFEIINVPFSKMPEVYRCADVFTLVSESTEAFGNVFVEAMATNLSVVATDDEQRREIIGEAGMYVSDPNKLASYAKTIEKALHKNWGDKPRMQAEKFNWDKIVKKYELLFDSLTNNS